MKKRMYGLAICLLPIACPSSAADLPVFKASPVPQWNWTACYLGVHVGGGGATSRQSDSTPAYINGDNVTYPFGFPGGIADPGSTSGASFLGGGQVGCRYETPQHLVFGLEGDFSGTSLRLNHTLGAGTITAPFLAGDTFTTRTDWQSSVRANIGYSWGRWLAYVTGGVAVAQMSVDGSYVAGNGGGPVTFLAASGSDEKTLVGLTVGAGAAYAIDNHWSIGAEYRYSNYGSQTFKLGTIRSDAAEAMSRAVVPVTGRTNLETHQIMAKLNYGFDLFKTPPSDKRWQSFASATPYSGGPRFYGGVEYL